MIELTGYVHRDALPATLVGRLQVFVDNDQVRGALACHTGEGWVDCYLRDERGCFVMAARAAVLTRLRGQVRVFVDRVDADEKAWLEGRRR